MTLGNGRHYLGLNSPPPLGPWVHHGEGRGGEAVLGWVWLCAGRKHNPISPRVAVQRSAQRVITSTGTTTPAQSHGNLLLQAGLALSKSEFLATLENKILEKRSYLSCV